MRLDGSMCGQRVDCAGREQIVRIDNRHILGFLNKKLPRFIYWIQNLYYNIPVLDFFTILVRFIYWIQNLYYNNRQQFADNAIMRREWNHYATTHRGTLNNRFLMGKQENIMKADTYLPTSLDNCSKFEKNYANTIVLYHESLSCWSHSYWRQQGKLQWFFFSCIIFIKHDFRQFEENLNLGFLNTLLRGNETYPA